MLQVDNKVIHMFAIRFLDAPSYTLDDAQFHCSIESIRSIISRFSGRAKVGKYNFKVK